MTEAATVEGCLQIRVGGVLRERRLIPADIMGRAVAELAAESGHSDALGVLLDDAAKDRPGRAFGIFPRRQRRTFLGVIWWNNPPRGATRNRWVFEVHGNSNVNVAKSLATRLIEVFEVEIRTIVITEDTRKEDFPL